MLRTVKHQFRGFLFGIAATIAVIGSTHMQIDFRINPEALQMQQTEQIAHQLEKVMPPSKPKVPHV